ERARSSDVRERGVVAAETGAVAGVEAGAALAHDDRAGGDGLAGEHLHAETLRVRVPPVPRGDEALLMRHLRCPPSASPRAASAPASACLRRSPRAYFASPASLPTTAYLR